MKVNLPDGNSPFSPAGMSWRERSVIVSLENGRSLESEIASDARNQLVDDFRPFIDDLTRRSVIKTSFQRTLSSGDVIRAYRFTSAYSGFKGFVRRQYHKVGLSRQERRYFESLAA